MDSATQNGDSDSESAQPESFSLSASASTAKEHDRTLRILYASQKLRTRETHKRRDEILKAQAGQRLRSIASSESGERNLEHHGVEVDDIEGGSDMDARLHRRMTRAMGDAEEEDSGSESGGEWGGIKSADPENFQKFQNRPKYEDTAISKGDTRALDSDIVPEDDTVAGSDDPGATQSTAGTYLPDHLFATALAKSRPRNDVRPSRTTPKARTTNKKRRHLPARTKDVVVGWVPMSQSFSSMKKTPSTAHVLSAPCHHLRQLYLSLHLERPSHPRVSRNS
jgi:hypothetical protein